MTILSQFESTQTMHYDPKRMGRLADPVIVLRKVNVAKLQRRATPQSDTPWELIGRGQVQLHVREDRLPWYEQGLIVNDQPRDEKVARDIAKATIGFAIARTDNGEIMRTYKADQLDQALADAKGAQLTIKAEITSIVAEEDDDEGLIEEFLSTVGSADSDETPNAQEA